MSKRSKVLDEGRMSVLRKYIGNEISRAEASRQCGVAPKTIDRWCIRYRTDGIAGFVPQENNRVYDAAAKEAAVKAYLSGEGVTVHKVYLSAILDLYDRRIVAFIIRDRNDNPLVFDTLDAAIKANPNAHPLFHSDRGFQYTNRVFYNKLKKAKMKQSMSRVAKCIDNGPMEGFWGILKRERFDR